MVLFIDTDPGTDDIMALIFILKYYSDIIVGMSSVAGNIGIDVTTRNLRLIAGYFNKTFGQKIPIFKGASQPIVKVSENDASDYHGADGCGSFYSTEYYKSHEKEIEDFINCAPLSETVAALGMIEMSKKYSGQLTIMAIGPLTNLALAQIIDPDFGSRLKEVLIMGGDLYGHGNSDVQVGAEFNFNGDPEAAFVVLKEISCKKTILPLETNFSVSIENIRVQEWIKGIGNTEDLIDNIMLSIMNFHVQKYPTLELYDLMLAMVLVEPSVITEILHVDAVVELEGRYTRGKLVIDHYNRSELHAFRPFRSVDIIKTLNRDEILKKFEKLFLCL